MKAAELQIGDLVVKPSGHIRTMGRAEFSNDDAWFRDTKPIPLTPEILEKNGFVLRGKTYILKWRGADIHWRKTDGHASITAPNNLKLEGWCSISNGYLCYVHILQHILRLCGLDELADNFKV